MENVNRIGATSAQLVSSNRESMNTFNSFYSWWGEEWIDRPERRSSSSIVRVKEPAGRVPRRVWHFRFDQPPFVAQYTHDGLFGRLSDTISHFSHTLSCLLSYCCSERSEKSEPQPQRHPIRAHGELPATSIVCARAYTSDQQKRSTTERIEREREWEREMAFMLAILKQQKNRTRNKSKQQHWYSIFLNDFHFFGGVSLSSRRRLARARKLSRSETSRACCWLCVVGLSLKISANGLNLSVFLWTSID